MHIDFHSSPRPTLGVEVETSLVERDTRALCGAGTEILSELGATHPEGEHPKAKSELFECTVEVITGVCSTVQEARDDLHQTMNELVTAAAERHADVMCSGTHPFSHWNDLSVTPKDRYLGLVDRLGWPARRLAIFGIHYHVGVPSAEASIAVMNSMVTYLPLFVSLSASSPFWHGRPTNLQSTRTKVFESLPTAGLPPTVSTWSEFEQLMETLIAADAIGTIREVWWDIRPHPDFGTVELRMCDGITNLDDICAVAAMAQCLVHDLSQRFLAGEPLPSVKDWIARENKWFAARFGMDGSFILDESGRRVPARELLQELIESLAPAARELGCTKELDQAGAMVSAPSSAMRQTAVIDDGGSMADVVDLLVHEFAVGMSK